MLSKSTIWRPASGFAGDNRRAQCRWRQEVAAESGQDRRVGTAQAIERRREAGHAAEGAVFDGVDFVDVVEVREGDRDEVAGAAVET